ncbi:MAG: cupredoxin domain-containing protein, partial [Thermomicrobiales bacterium]
VLTPPAYKDGVFYYVITNRPTWHRSDGPDFTPQDPFEGEIGALDATNGTILWKADLPTYPTGSIIVANDLVITAGLDGLVRAFTRADGKAVWYFQMGAGVNAPVVIAGDDLFVAAGTQYRPSPDQRDPGAEAAYELVRFNIGPGGGFVPDAQPTRLPAEEAASATAEASPAAASGDVATPETATDGSLTLAVEMGDLYFKPTAIAIPANNDVKVTLTNVGALQHDFVIDNHVNSGMVVGGSSTEFTVNLVPGEYKFYCSVEGHAAAGMVGTLVAE